PSSAGNITLVSSNGTNTYTAVTIAGGEQLTLSLMPATNQYGVASITITVSDGKASDVSTSFDLTVTNVNDSPIITSIGNQNTNEDIEMSAVTFTVADVDNEALTVNVSSSNTSIIALNNSNITLFSATGGDSYSLETVAGGESLTLTLLPLSNANGTVQITVTVTDSSAASSNTSFTLTVNAVNDLPTITSINDATTSEETEVTLNSFTVADADGDTMTISVESSNTTLIPSNSANITLRNASVGDTYTLSTTADTDNLTLSLLPALNQSGNATLTVTVTDGTGNASTSFALTVTNVNDPPTLSSITDQTTDEDSTINAIAFTITDVDQDALQLSSSSSNLTLVALNNISFTTTNTMISQNNTYTVTLAPATTAAMFVTITPTANIYGTSTITLSVSDGTLSNNITFVVTVSSVNDAPTITLPPGVLTTKENTALTITSLSIADLDAGSNAVQATLVVGSDGIMIFTSVSNLTFVNSTSNSSDTMSFTGTIADINTALTGLSYSPVLNAIGDRSITITVNDLGYTGAGSSESVTGVVQIRITDENVGPTNSLPPTLSVNEDEALDITPISVYDPDAESEALYITITAANGYMTLSGTTNLILIDGSFTASQSMSFTGSQANINTALENLSLTTTTNYNGFAAITLTTNDLGHSGEGYTPYADTDSITITVVAVNDNPVNTLPTSLTTTEEVPTTFIASVSDIDGYSVNVVLTSDAGTLSLSGTSGLTGYTGTAASTLSFTGTIDDVNSAMALITFAPTLNTFGSYAITMTTNDLGNTGIPGARTDIDSLALTITGLNDAPTIAASTGLTVNEDNSLNLTVTISDVDAYTNNMNVNIIVENGLISLNGEAGLTLEPSAQNISALTITAGTITDINTALASFTFTPTSDYYGDAGITITVNDQGYAINNNQQGTPETVQEFVSITVNAVNDAPAFTLSNTSISVNEDFSTSESITVTIGTIPYGESSQTITYSLTPSSVNWANVSYNSSTGEITITSASNMNGYTSFIVTANDGQSSNNTATQTFELTVVSVNDAPAFALDATQITATEDFSETYTINVTPNSIPTDEQGQTVVYSLSPTVNWANLYINSNSGQITITAVQNASGSQTFTVTANDQQVANNTATQNFSLTITDINDAPSFAISTSAISVDEDFTNTVNVNVTPYTPSMGEESQTVSYSLTPSSVTWANITFNSNSGNVTITSLSNANGITSFIITANDGQSENNTATQSFTLTVTAVNDPPSFTMSTTAVDVSEDFTQTQQITVTRGTVPDDESNNVSYSLVPASVDWATITLDSETGAITITAIENMNGITSFVLTANDSGTENNTASDSFTLTIAAVNDPPAFTLSTASMTLNEDFTGSETITVTPGSVPSDEPGSVTYTINPAFLTWVNMSVNATTGAITFTNVAHGHGSQLVVVTADDGASSNNTATQSFSITVNSINDLPVLTSGTSFSITENTAIGTTVHTVTATDADGDNLTYSLTTIDPSTPESFAITESNGNIWISSNISFETSASYTLTVSVSDGVSTATQSISVTINDVNDPPIIDAPTQQLSCSRNEAFAITTVSVSDDDSGSDPIQLTLTATNGVVSITGTGIAIVSGTYSSSTFSVTGTVLAISNALSQMVFNPTTDYTGTASILVEANDLGNTGTGGPQSVTALVGIFVAGVNQAPTISGLSPDVTLDEDQSLTRTIIITDVDAADNAIQFTMVTSNGTLTLVGTSGLTTITGTGTDDRLMSFTGSVSNINTALASLLFEPDTEFSGNAGYTMYVNDLGNSGTGSAQEAIPASLSVTYLAVNDAPVNALPTSLSILEDTAVSMTLSVSDPDAASNAIQVTLTALNGTITLANISGLSFVTNDGTADVNMSFTGTVTSINAAMNTMSFSPTADYFGDAGITLTTNDLGNSIPSGTTTAKTDTDYLTITISNVNDDPVFSSTAIETINEDSTYSYNITITDADSADSITITASYASFLSFTDNGNRTALLTGTPTNDNVGSESISITATDGQGNAVQTFTLVINNT
ncbi:hemagglutinin/hemolysin-like protein, partial [Candidatus Magnetomorum sp. HK-1]